MEVTNPSRGGQAETRRLGRTETSETSAMVCDSVSVGDLDLSDAVFGRGPYRRDESGE